jgi:tetratricopeptide (TPR) repeat protein
MRKFRVLLIGIIFARGILAPAVGAGGVSPSVTGFDPNAIVVLGCLDRRQDLLANAEWPRVAFAIGDGTLLLTAAHCVTDLQPAPRRTVSTDIVVISPYYGDIFGLRILAIDKETDLAILKPAWPSHPALSLATEEELVAAKRILIVSRPQNKQVHADLRTELLPVLQLNETSPKSALSLKGTKLVVPGWSGSAMLLPDTDKVAGVLNQLRVRKFQFSIFFHSTRSDAIGCSVRSIRSLLQKHDLEAIALRPPGRFEPVPDAQQGFACAIGTFQAIFSQNKGRVVDSAKELARLRPDSVQAHLLLAFAAMVPTDESARPNEGQFNLAESSYKRALEIDSNNAYAHAAYGSFLIARGRNVQARVQSEAALAIDPNNRLAQLDRLRLLPVAEHIAALERLTDEDANDPDYWFQFSGALLSQGRKEDALKAAQKAVDLDPNGLFYATLANALVSLGRVDEAEPYYRRMADRCGCQRCWYMYAGFLLTHRPDKLDEASRAFAKAESKASMARVSEQNMTTLKYLLLEKTSPQEAESVARKRLDADPNDAETWWQLAGILRTQNKYAEALAAARKAVEIKPDERYQPRLANCLAKAGELEAAQQVYDGMLQRHPENCRYWYWYAEFLVDYHPTRLDEARQALEKARTGSDPNWPTAPGDLKKLQDRIDSVTPPSGSRPQYPNDAPLIEQQGDVTFNS